MRESATRRGTLRRTLVLLGVFAAAFAIGAVFFESPLGSDSGGESELTTMGLVDWLNGVDAVVSVSEVAPTGETMSDSSDADTGARYAVFQARVQRVLWADPEAGAELTAGGLVRLASGYVSAGGPHRLSDVDGGDAVLFLASPDVEQYPDFAGVWGVSVVAREGDEGLAFPDPLAGSARWEAQVVSLRRFVSGVSAEKASLFGRDADAELRLMVDWVRELRRPQPVADGPITEAFLGSERQRFDRDVAWYQMSPSLRPVDPELTPESVLSGLSERTLLVEVPEDARLPNVFMVTRTDTGVVHSAELAGGSHPVSVFAADTEELRVYIMTDEGLDGTLVGVVPPVRGQRGIAADLIVIDRSVVDAVLADRNQPSVAVGEIVTPLDGTGMQAWIDRMAAESPAGDPRPPKDPVVEGEGGP